MIEEKNITMVMLDSGDKGLDVIYFIKQMFSQWELSDKEKIKVLDYLKSEINQSE